MTTISETHFDERTPDTASSFIALTLRLPALNPNACFDFRSVCTPLQQLWIYGCLDIDTCVGNHAMRAAEAGTRVHQEIEKQMTVGGVHRMRDFVINDGEIYVTDYKTPDFTGI